MNEFRYSLCPNCDACPEVVIQDDSVLIGEPGNQARLSPAEWNGLVAGVKSGSLKAVGDATGDTSVCDCGCDCC